MWKIPVLVGLFVINASTANATLPGWAKNILTKNFDPTTGKASRQVWVPETCSASLSAPGEAKICFDTGTNTFQQSVDGGAYVEFGTGGGIDTTCNDAGVNCAFAGSATEGGVATSALQLAADPAACPAGDFATDIDTDGTLTCQTPAGSGDITAVYDCATGACTDVALQAGESLDMRTVDPTAAGTGLQVPGALNCTGGTPTTQSACYDQTADAWCVYDGSAWDCVPLSAHSPNCETTACDLNASSTINSAGICTSTGTPGSNCPAKSAYLPTTDAEVPDGITVDISTGAVTGGTVNRCAYFNGSGVLTAASGNCASGDTGGGSGISGIGDASTGDVLKDGVVYASGYCMTYEGSTDNAIDHKFCFTGNPTGASTQVDMPHETGTLCTTAGSAACLAIYGDVNGPATSTATALAVWSNTNGTAQVNSECVLADTDADSLGDELTCPGGVISADQGCANNTDCNAFALPYNDGGGTPTCTTVGEANVHKILPKSDNTVVLCSGTSEIGTVGGTNPFGADIGPTELANTDFGDFACNGTTCSVEDESHAHTTTSVSGLDASADTNLTAGRSLTLTDDDMAADAELYTGVIPIAIQAPTTGASGLVQIEVPSAITITRVDCSTDTGTATIQLDERALTTPNTVGTDVMTSTLVCDNNNQQTTAFDNAAIAANAIINLDVDAVASTPGQLRIHVRYTVDD